MMHEMSDEPDESDRIKPKKIKGGGFQTMGLVPNVFKGVMGMGYRIPTPIQRKCLPNALMGSDVVAMARTGSGKTCAFVIPILQRLQSHSTVIGARALIVSPTRELSLQTFAVCQKMAKYTDLRICSIIGGSSLDAQFEDLSNNPDIIIATPGRIIHHLHEVPTFKLTSIQLVVFDEADRLFEMGFSDQMKELMLSMNPAATTLSDLSDNTGSNQQVLLFSATMPRALANFTRSVGLRNPCVIRLDSDAELSDTLCMAFVTTRQLEKEASLLFLLTETDLLLTPGVEDNQTKSAVIFVATRHHAEYLYEMLMALVAPVLGVRVSMIHGSLDQEARTDGLNRFRSGESKILIVTDVAARGLDIPELDVVINYHFPASPRLFIHRIGRTARRGRKGIAVSLVDPSELPYMFDVLKYIGKVDAILNRSDDAPDACYSFNDATPDKTDVGFIPQYLIDLRNEAVSQFAVGSYSILKVCYNAMKLYNKTRSNATHTGVSASKQFTSKRERIHPVFVDFSSPDATKLNERSRDLLESIRSYRPSLTDVELKMKGKFADSDDGMRTIKAMMDMRREVTKANLKKKEVIIEEPADEKEEADVHVEMQPVAVVRHAKPRMSIAMRKRLKSGKTIDSASAKDIAANAQWSNNPHDGIFSTSKLLEDDDDDPVAASNKQIDDATFDLYDDDIRGLHKTSLMKKWDAKKRKYVGSDGNDDLKKKKKMRTIVNESGVLVDVSHDEDGAIYQRWSKSSKKTIDPIGHEESQAYGSDLAMSEPVTRGRRGRFTGGGIKKPANDDDDQEFSSFAKSELKTPAEIARQEKDDEMKRFRNLPRSERIRLRTKRKDEVSKRVRFENHFPGAQYTRSKIIMR